MVMFFQEEECEDYEECFSNDNLEAVHKVVYCRPY